jgi:hypothetical protein
MIPKHYTAIINTVFPILTFHKKVTITADTEP